ncbi:MAG: reverse transcriptase N-terminal domain-containing protein [Holosporaceae bacterium]|jgi:group II intron reverse transcriptase/maturase|nr:reverse transcriptase N-terminal domain-containing protein [Holosporaceae bacterium]
MIEAGIFNEELLNSLWNNANWDKLKNALWNMQRDIALATKGGDRDALSMYQKKLTSSLDAKMLAVRHVMTKCRTPGVDGIRWSTPSECMRAALSLEDDGYLASTLRLVVMYSTFSSKERRIKIPTYHDRAMQILHAYALSPVEETMGDSRSFAFRKNRSTQDVHAHIMSALKRGVDYIVKADVKSCYESINHDWLLSNIPMDTRVLREFLKAGHVSAGEFFPAEDHGISLGVSISPILGNLTLDGLQKKIFEGLHGLGYDEQYCEGQLIRFADDIFVTAYSADKAKRIIDIMECFLRQRGMRLSHEKTTVISVHQGFDFLSRHYMRQDKAIISQPSDTAIMKMEHVLRELILSFSGSQKVLIDKLNKKLHGWASYHKITDAQKAFRHIDVVVKILLLKLCEQRHPGWKRSKIINYYFFQDHRGRYVYALPDKKDERVIRLGDIALIEHIPAKNTNPYLPSSIQEKFDELRDINNIVGKYKAVWHRQDGRCLYCGEQILVDQKKSIVQMRNQKNSWAKNIAYIHAKCGLHKVEFTETEEPLENYEDISVILEMLRRNDKQKKKPYKFSVLNEYFHKKNEAVFTLNFDEISHILGYPLCKSAFTSSGYWHSRRPGTISASWLANGYKIKKLKLRDKRIVFTQMDHKCSIKIPEVFIQDRIPKNAKAELEAFFDYIKRKYGL